MKNLFYLGALMILSTSCVPQTQLITLTANNNTLNSNNFVYRDSLVTITYDFYSRNGLMRFQIYNNCSHPIYIDWQKSGYITSDDKKNSYWTDKAKLTADANGEGENGGISATIKGTIQKEEKTSFLPPKTKVEVGKFSIAGLKPFPPGKNKEIVMEKKSWRKANKDIAITQYNYTKEDSPLSFRNYLVISTTEDFHNPVYYDFGFWISKIEDMNAKQLVGDKLYMTYSDKWQPGSKYHPYKKPNRFFLFEK